MQELSRNRAKNCDGMTRQGADLSQDALRLMEDAELP